MVNALPRAISIAPAVTGIMFAIGKTSIRALAGSAEDRLLGQQLTSRDIRDERGEDESLTHRRQQAD